MSTGRGLLQDLLNDRSFDNIAYTRVTGLGPDHFIDSRGRIVSDAGVQAQAERRTLVDQTPEVTAEDIMQGNFDDGSGMQHNNGDDQERFDVVSPVQEYYQDDNGNDELPFPDGQNAGKDVRFQTPDGGSEPPAHDSSPSRDGSEPPVVQEQGAQAAVPTAPAAKKSPRGKRWSEMKEWQLVIAAAKGTGPCPDNVYQIVDHCMRFQKQTKLKTKYAEILARAVENGWEDKTSAIQQAQSDIEKMEKKLDRANKQLDKKKAEVVRLEAELKKAMQKNGKTTVLAAKKSPSKGKNKETASADPTFQLPLPAVPEARMTSQAPKSVKQYVQHSETLLDQGARLLRSTEEAGWSERAVNWLATVETRPELKYN
jgi:hypothetical protein